MIDLIPEFKGIPPKRNFEKADESNGNIKNNKLNNSIYCFYKLLCSYSGNLESMKLII